MGTPVTILWVTDPHNVWCWGMEPAMRRFEVLYPGAIEVKICQGGLFEDFRPVREQWARMSGGRWKDSILAFFDAVSAQHRMPMDGERMLEETDDFDSTWPACIAAKAADLQGEEPGRRYLRALREAWCLDGRGIQRRSVQVQVAGEVGLDAAAFEAALVDGRAERAFAADRDIAHATGVTGFPTFEIDRGDEHVRIEGWQPWEAFDEVVRKLDPDLAAKEIAPTAASVRDLFRRYPRLATREVASILGVPDDDAEILLEDLEASDEVARRPVGRALIWQRPAVSATTSETGERSSV